MSLASSYNIAGISSDGVPYFTGGYDGSSWALSSELLGNTVTWKGVAFPLGPANAPDAVANATIQIPEGTFGSLLLIGSLVNNVIPATGRFVLQYTDGSTTAVDQEFSDWVNPRNYPGEAIAVCTPTRHNYDGSIDRNSACVYGYTLPVDPSRTLASVTLPATRNVVILSAVALPPDVSGSFSYTPASGAVLASGIQPLAVSFTPTVASSFGSAQGSNRLVVQPPTPLLTPSLKWPVPAAVLPGATLTAAQLNATASAPLAPVQVSLAYRINALYPDGALYSEKGFDGTSTAFSSALLGPSLRYAGFVFPLGPPLLPDAATSSTFALPSGSFSTLYLLGAGSNGAQMAQPFTITYTDGSAATTLLDLSSWRAPQHFAGETIVASTAYANLADGQQLAGSYSVYGYQMALDPARVPATLTMPSNTNVVLLAAGLGTATSFSVPGTFVYTPPAGTVIQSFTTLRTNFTPTDSLDLTSAQASVPLIVGLRDFTLSAPNGSTLTAILGESPSLTFAVAPVNDQYSGPLTFTLEGELPPLATYTIDPPGAAATAGPMTLTVTVHSRRLSASLDGGAALAFFGLVLLMRKRSRRLLPLLLLLPLGCGSGYHNANYALTLVATDGHFRHTLPVTLHILASGQ